MNPSESNINVLKRTCTVHFLNYINGVIINQSIGTRSLFVFLETNSDRGLFCCTDRRKVVFVFFIWVVIFYLF